MKRFTLERNSDVSGVSGTGTVAEGVMFSNGRAALSWRTDLTSTAVYDSICDLEAIHGHNGATTIEWIDA
jgi:hypothetical protein